MPTYRFENSKTGRAVCKNKGCNDKQVRIDKGELRFGTLVTIKDHDSWLWRHWNCVTPDQWTNISNYLSELGGLDYLDGFDEVDDESKERIQQCLLDGKVPDEDWRQDPELNVPGGRRKATPKKKKAAAEDDADASGEVNGTDTTPSKPKKSRKVKADEEAAAPKQSKPKKKQASKKRKADTEPPEPESELSPSASPVPAKKPRAKKVKQEEAEDVSPVPPAKKARASKKVKSEDLNVDEERAPKKRAKAKSRAKVEPQDDSDAPLTTEHAEEEPEAEVDDAAKPKKGKKKATKATGRGKKAKA